MNNKTNTDRQPYFYKIKRSLWGLLCLFPLWVVPLAAQESVADLTNVAAFLKKNNVLAAPISDGVWVAHQGAIKGAAIRKGDYVKMSYVGRLLDGKEFDRSAKETPFIFQVGYRQVIEGLDEGVAALRVGSKAAIYLSSAKGYGATGVGTTIAPNAALIFDVEVMDVMDAAQYDKYITNLEAKERKEFEAHAKEQFKKDKKEIQNFAISHKLKVKRLDSGLSYVVTKVGKGDNARAGDALEVHYEGFLTNDQLFDSSLRKNEPYQFELGKEKVIAGWEEGLPFFNKGSEGWLLVPSRLAYGRRAIEEKGITIPADAVLCFKINVVEVKKK